MKKLLAVVAAAAALSFGLPGGANATVLSCTDGVQLIRSIGTDFEEIIGNVNVSCSGYTLTVAFDTRPFPLSAGDGTWNLLETNVHVEEYGVGNALCEGLPQNKNSNPQPGKFNTDAQTFKISDGTQVAAHGFGLGLSVSTTVVIAAHAMVRNQEPPPPFDEAWGDGTPFGGASGATCFMVTIDVNG